MKKLVFALAVCIAAVANADVIYWMVDPNETVTGYDGQKHAWANAILTIQEDSGIYQHEFWNASEWSLAKKDAVGLAAWGDYEAAQLGSIDYSGKYFLIELFNDAGKWIGGYSADAASVAQFITKNDMTPLPSSGFGMNVSYAVPEPTSGLLFLVGGMLLGLRRRRQV